MTIGSGCRRSINTLVGFMDRKTFELRFFIIRKFRPSEIVASGMFSVEAFEYLKEISKNSDILEFGSGGSTLILGDIAKSVTSIESDKHFARKVKDATQSKENVSVNYLNIGITKSYGHPLRSLRIFSKRKYDNYVNYVWSRNIINKFDVVIIDGRFRVSTALQSVLSNPLPFHLVIDDYTLRPEYWVIEKCLGKPNRIYGVTPFFYVNSRSNFDVIKEIRDTHRFNDN